METLVYFIVGCKTGNFIWDFKGKHMTVKPWPNTMKYTRRFPYIFRLTTNVHPTFEQISAEISPLVPCPSNTPNKIICLHAPCEK